MMGTPVSEKLSTPVSEKLSNLSSYLCFHFYSLELLIWNLLIFFFLFLPELTFSCKLHWGFFSIYLTKKNHFFSVYWR